MPEYPNEPRQNVHYAAKAAQVAHRVRGDWEHGPLQDVKALVDEVQCALTEEANHELRQVLFQLQAQLELILVKSRKGEAAIAPPVAEKMFSAVSRAAAIVDQFLDRGEAAKLVIPIDATTFDIGEALSHMLDWNGFTAPRANTIVDVDPVVITGDPDRLLDVLGHLASRFFFARKQREPLVVRLKSDGDKIQGFVGLRSPDISPQDLIAEFDKPLRMDDMAIDIPYTRAVIERHGGTLYVAAAEHGANGFGFHLPLTPSQEDPPHG